MPENSVKVDPFKPAQPVIPGVSQPSAAARGEIHDPPAFPDEPEAPRAAIPAKWVAGAVAGVAIAAILLFVWWNGNRSTAETTESAVPASLPNPPSSARQLAQNLPLAPGTVATTEELAKPWSYREFEFKNARTGDLGLAMVVHLPGGTYWAFSLEEPFGTCQLDFYTDLQKLRDEYSFAAVHPMVVNPCSHSVYDLTKYGSGPNGLVRGEVEQGPAIRPPLAIEVRIEGNRVVAVRSE